VNSTNPDDDTNGALSKVMPMIAKNDPRNPYGKTFVQLQEMGRDQAHAWDDVTMLTQLARVIDIQGTKLDPVRATVSTRRDAVSVYAFGGDRLLRGSEPDLRPDQRALHRLQAEARGCHRHDRTEHHRTGHDTGRRRPVLLGNIAVQRLEQEPGLQSGFLAVLPRLRRRIGTSGPA
jgi:hypothetical protein